MSPAACDDDCLAQAVADRMLEQNTFVRRVYAHASTQKAFGIAVQWETGRTDSVRAHRHEFSSSRPLSATAEVVANHFLLRAPNRKPIASAPDPG